MEDVVTLLGRVMGCGGNRRKGGMDRVTRRGVGVDCGGPALSMRVSFPVAAATACMYERKERSRRDAARQLQPAARADAQETQRPSLVTV